MERNYYLVEAKCGHVGRNFYVIKKLPIIASSSEEATDIAINTPRVKHHKKDVIKSLRKINEEEYLKALENKNSDPYFHIYNTSDRKFLSPNYKYERIPEARDENNYSHDKIDYRFRNKKERLARKEAELEFAYYDIESCWA